MCLPTNTTQYHADQDRQREGHRAASQCEIYSDLKLWSNESLYALGDQASEACTYVRGFFKSMNTLTFLSKIFPADSDIHIFGGI